MNLFGALLPQVLLFAYCAGLGIYAHLALGALALGTFCDPCHLGQSLAPVREHEHAED